MELLTGKVIYHVETQEDYDDLMGRLEELGYKWEGTKSATNLRNIWAILKDESHIRLYGDKTLTCIDSHYANNYLSDYKIIKYKKEQSMKVKLKADQKFIADWYENHKDYLDYYIFEEHADLSDLSEEDIAKDKFFSWLNDGENKPVQTLVKMHIFGYEIEQEPLYYVELPNPNYESKVKKYYLARTADSRIVIQSGNTAEIKENWKLTESEIKKDFEWAWDFAKEV